MLEKTVQEIRSCTICADHLPMAPKPIFTVHPKAKIGIISQAPGRLAHNSGIPWDDQSGDRLRQWLDVDRDTFYDTPHFAVIPMGFCYPGKGKSGDLPPRKECAPQWHETVLKLMPDIELFLIIGMYAQKKYLGKNRKKTLTATVEHFEAYLPQYFPLPHPSPLNTRWLRRNQWYEEEVVPVLREKVAQIIR
jgi:uracil-DNA glycosylase